MSIESLRCQGCHIDCFWQLSEPSVADLQETINVAEHCTELKVPEPWPQHKILLHRLCYPSSLESGSSTEARSCSNQDSGRTALALQLVHRHVPGRRRKNRCGLSRFHTSPPGNITCKLFGLHGAPSRLRRCFSKLRPGPGFRARARSVGAKTPPQRRGDALLCIQTSSSD